MQPLHIYSVVPKLPPSLNPLWELAYNLLFDWHHEITELFAHIDHKLWKECQSNPVQFLNGLTQKRIEDLSHDEYFLERLKDVHSILAHYVARKSSALSFSKVGDGHPIVAYFSLEYGLASCLPIYSGGLGILAGDHLKSASDLNIPLVGVGLAYQQGYFRQYLNPDGWQQERYPIYDFEQMPMSLVKDKNGKPLIVNLELVGRELLFRIWEVRVGRIRLFLLDTNIPANPADFRHITFQLYGGDLETRIRQEILLGIGGYKTLAMLGLEPKVIHMNEGHSAFAGLERIRLLMKYNGLSFEAAQELTAASSVFTTHTPVPAGIDRFPQDLMQKYFEKYASDMGLYFKVFMALGRENQRDDHEQFCMTVLALRLSRFNNGVSVLHGAVSRKMWARVWPQYPVEDVPIQAVTNGVHIPSWVARDLSVLYDRYLGGNWKEESDCQRIWALSETIPDAELWRTHERLKERLVEFVRARMRDQLMFRGARRAELQISDEVLNPQALTIGFARRFATYKRANLLLMDKERIKKIISDTQRPVQFIFAGKAHPQDNEGKRIIQQIVQTFKEHEFRYSMVFLEDYDMEVAAHLIQGCDVWLNNPRRPLEACGTSGMKAAANAVLNFSTLDGWWVEAHKMDQEIGWAIGQGEEYDDLGYQDFVESQILYNVLENDLIPTFYERGHGNLPRMWIRRMKKSLNMLAPYFNSHRMVEDYVRTSYEPAYKNYTMLTASQFAPAKDLAVWRMDIMTKWNELKIRDATLEEKDELFVGDKISVKARVFLNGLKPHDVQVEIYHGPVDYDSRFSSRKTTIMRPIREDGEGWYLYEGKTHPEQAGRFGFTVRMLPNHPLLTDAHSLGLIQWAS